MSTQSAAPSLAEPLQRIRIGALIIIIGFLLGGVGNIMLMLLMPSIPKVFTNTHALLNAISRGIFAMVLLFLGSIVVLIGLFIGLVPGVKKLSKVDDRFSTASTLIRIGYVWGVILLVIGVIVAVAGLVSYISAVISHGGQFAGGALAALAAGGIIALIGGILVLLGYVGVIVLAFKLSDVEHNSLYLVAGILFIVGIIVDAFALFVSLASVFAPFVAVVAWILMYIALGKSIERHKAPPQQPAPAPAPTLV